MSSILWDYVQARVEKADDVAARLVLEKLDEEDAKKMAKQEMLVYSDKQKNSKKEFDQNISTLQVSSTLFL